MSHSLNDLQNASDSLLKNNPVLGFVLCVFVAITTAITSSDTSHWQFPVIIMQIGQWIAWFFAYAVGIITIIGFLERVFDFKLNLKKYFKRKPKK